MNWFWNLELIDSPLEAVVVGVALVCALVVAWAARGRRNRHPAFRWFLASILAGAAVLGVGVRWLQHLGTFEGALPEGTAPWVVGAGALVGLGVLGLVCPPWWSRVLSTVLILAALLGMGLQVNRLYGMTNTPALVFGIDTTPGLHLPRMLSGAHRDKVTIATWKPPAGLPMRGKVGQLEGVNAIPSSKPYAPRNASVYLPPAALAAHPPRLPVVVAMMGQPGTPDPRRMAAAGDAYAAQHRGLAPIIVVVDQLAGSPGNDPACVDSSTYGAVSTYVNTDVVAYIKARFNVLEDPRDWAIAGYSNGGSCAWQWGTQYPQTWGAILDVSGNQFPGSEDQARVIDELWGGNRAAYEAWLPSAQLRRHPGAYAGRLASFTWGQNDRRYGPQAQINIAEARRAGFRVVTHEIAGAGHVGVASHEGLVEVVADFGDFAGLGGQRGSLPRR